MPQYDYLCATCGGVQTLERSIHAEAADPICCQQVMGRKYDSPAIQWNASGFYNNTP